MSDTVSLAEQWVLEIIRGYMGLSEAQAWVSEQNKRIPQDDGLYVTAGMADSIPYGNKTEIITRSMQPPTGDPVVQTVEVQYLHEQENIQINIQSRSNAALKRRREIIFALGSILSQQTQEKYAFKIARIPKSFLNASSTEGGARINKFVVVVPCLTMHKIEKVLEANSGKYYDDFRTRVDDEKSIETPHGIIEFEIDPDTPEPDIGV